MNRVSSTAAAADKQTIDLVLGKVEQVNTQLDQEEEKKAKESVANAKATVEGLIAAR